MRIKSRDEHNRVALTVIYFLGGIAFGAMMWSGYLIHEAVVSDNAIDSAAVALVGQMVSISTLSLGALGAMLSSTSPKPPPPPSVTDSAGQESTPVTVVNPTEDPVPTDPADPVEAEPEPDPDPVDVPAAKPARARRA